MRVKGAKYEAREGARGWEWEVAKGGGDGLGGGGGDGRGRRTGRWSKRGAGARAGGICFAGARGHLGLGQSINNCFCPGDSICLFIICFTRIHTHRWG